MNNHDSTSLGKQCMEEAPLIQQNYCGYEDCQRPIEAVPGHRPREYCNDACRQAARRLRRAREQLGKKADLDSFLRRVHSARLRAILSRVLRDQGEVEPKHVAHLEAQLAEYRKIIDLDDRTKIAQQFMAVGEILGYRALPKFGIGGSVQDWKDYQSWTHELTLAEVILHGRELLDKEAAVRERVENRSKLRQAEREIQALRKQIGELSAGQAEWRAWKEAEVRGTGSLTMMRGYLQEHIGQSIPLKRNGVTVKIVALGDDAIAVSEDHGVIRLSDEELQQGRVWVCKKSSVPVIATWLPIGQSRKEGQRRLQIEQELDAAQAEIQSLQRELARHLPPPRALLECTLRRWCSKVTLPYEELKGTELDVFLRESSER